MDGSAPCSNKSFTNGMLLRFAATHKGVLPLVCCCRISQSNGDNNKMIRHQTRDEEFTQTQETSEKKDEKTKRRKDEKKKGGPSCECWGQPREKGGNSQHASDQFRHHICHFHKQNGWQIFRPALPCTHK
jgi:hypothetical protein